MPKKQQEARWAQYLISRRNVRNERRMGKTRGIKLKARGDKLTMMMSPCAKHYFATQVSPFSLKTPACIPDLHAIPSKKIRVKSRFTFSTGLNGFGWCVVSPWCNANGSTVAGFTLPTYGGPNIITIPGTIVTGTSSYAETKLPYSSGQFQAAGSQPGIQARTVGFGMRIRYIGPESSRSGQIVGLRHPDNESLVGFSDTQIRTYESAKTFANKKDWVYALYRPVQPREYEFSPDDCTASDGINFKWSIAFTITGTTDINGNPSPAPFEAELIRFVEYIGSIDNITQTHVDVQGVGVVRNSLPVKSVHNDNMKHVLTAASRANTALQAAAPVIGGAIGGYQLANHLAGSSDLPPGGYSSIEADNALWRGAGVTDTSLLTEAEEVGGTVLAGAEELLPLMLL